MNATVWGQTLVSALLMSSVYALFALGLTMLFGLLDIVNFAHGQLLLGGAYITYSIVNNGMSYWIGLLVAVLCVSACGAVLDVALFARVRKDPINGLLLSIGLISVFEGLYQAQWGVNLLDVPAPLGSVWHVGSVVISADTVLVIAATVIIVAALAAFLRRSRLGRALRATGQNPEAAALMGIGTERIRTLTFAVGAGLAGLSGALLAAVFPVQPSLGTNPLLSGFAVLILGGAGSPLGAVLGAVVVGFVQTFVGQFWTSSAASIIVFSVVIVVLYFRPYGLIRVQRVGTL